MKGRRVTREVLLRGAADLLEGGRYGDLTVDGLARHLGMSKSTLYKHFLGKDAVVERLVQTLCEQTEGLLSELDGAGPKQGFEALVRVLADHANRLPRAVVLQRERLPLEAQQRLQQTRDHLVAALGDVFHDGTDSGFYSVGRPRVMAVAVIAAGFAAMAEAAELELPRGDCVSEVLLVVGEGLAA